MDRRLGAGQHEQFGDDHQSNEGVRSSPTQSTEQRFYILMQYLARCPVDQRAGRGRLGRFERDAERYQDAGHRLVLRPDQQLHGRPL